jgi:hypothetical protein
VRESQRLSQRGREGDRERDAIVVFCESACPYANKYHYFMCVHACSQRKNTQNLEKRR